MEICITHQLKSLSAIYSTFSISARSTLCELGQFCYFHGKRGYSVFPIRLFEILCRQNLYSTHIVSFLQASERAIAPTKAPSRSSVYAVNRSASSILRNSPLSSSASRSSTSTASRSARYSCFTYRAAHHVHVGDDDGGARAVVGRGKAVDGGLWRRGGVRRLFPL